MPDQLDDYQGQIEAASQDARALASGLDDARFNWRPGAGRWSMAECLAHLNVTNEKYLVAIDRAIGEARERGWAGRGPFRYGFFSSLMVRMAEPPVKHRGRAPGVFAPPPEQPLSVVLPAFLSVQEQISRRLEGARGLDLRRPRVVSPVTGLVRLNLGAAFAMIAAHNRRHLWQARQVREHPDFPYA